MLRTLVSSAEAEGPPGAGEARDSKSGLCIDWTVPNVLVADVADFQSLSPELEAGTALPGLLSLGAGTQPGAGIGQGRALNARGSRGSPRHHPSLPWGVPTHCSDAEG